MKCDGSSGIKRKQWDRKKHSLYSNDSFFTLETGGVRNISNQLSITTKIDREHPEMREYAKSKGWWDGEKEFDFAATYSYVNTARMTTSRSRYCEGYKLLNKHKGIFFGLFKIVRRATLI